MVWLSADFEPDIALEVALDYMEQGFLVTPIYSSSDMLRKQPKGYRIDSPAGASLECDAVPQTSA